MPHLKVNFNCRSDKALRPYLTLSHRPIFVDETLQNIRSNLTLVRGVTFAMNGNFKQILPMVSRRTRADEVQVLCEGYIPLATCAQGTHINRHESPPAGRPVSRIV